MVKEVRFTTLFDKYVKHKRQTMMSKADLNTQSEEKILAAAEKVFYLKGKEGTSMQDIADEAGITRTSLNYYYRSKDKLFDVVFRSAMKQFIPKISMLMESDQPMVEYLPKLTEIIIDTMLAKPQIPVFVLQELTSNPERMPQIWAEMGVRPDQAIKRMKEDPVMASLPVDPRQLVINVISMCIFPFAAKPLLLNLMFENDEEAFLEAMRMRKNIIPTMIQNMLKENER